MLSPWVALPFFFAFGFSLAFFNERYRFLGAGSNIKISADDFSPQVYSFFKDWECGAKDREIPGLITQAPAEDTSRVVVDVGIATGAEFFQAVLKGYTVYGFEANPLYLKDLSKQCEEIPGCHYIPITPGQPPPHLPPDRGTSYLIGAAAGNETRTVGMYLQGFVSSYAELPPGMKGKKSGQNHQQAEPVEVPMLRIDDLVKSDVYFLKIDAQGADPYVLQGAEKLFTEHTVKNLMMEVYPRGLLNGGANLHAMLNYLWYDLGMVCSTASGKFPLDHTNSFAGFADFLREKGKNAGAKIGQWDDFICFNRLKAWRS